MKRILLIAALLVALFAIPAFADVDISIELDGLKVITPVDAGPRLVNGRVLVPLRYLATALGGDVDYDEQTRTALIFFNSSLVRFPLDKNLMYINQDTIAIDVAAQAFSGRTYIPARYLAEAVGASVDWDELAHTVLVRTEAQERELIACYALGSAQQFQSFGQHVHRAMVRWAELALVGDTVALKPTLPPSYEIVAAEWAPERGVELSLQVFCDRLNILSVLLQSPLQVREEVAQSIVDLALELGFSGVNLDLEGITQSHLKDAFTEFVTLVSLKSREQQLHVSAYVHPKTTVTDYGAYDYKALAEVLDQVIVMAHDLVITSNPPAPPAPLKWVEQVIRFALTDGGVPKEKLILGVSLYSLNWPKHTSERALSQGMLTFSEEWLASRGLVAIPYNETHGMGYLEYTSPADGERILWAETLESMAAKAALVDKYNLAGLSFWRLGGAHPDLFLPSGPFGSFK